MFPNLRRVVFEETQVKPGVLERLQERLPHLETFDCEGVLISSNDMNLAWRNGYLMEGGWTAAQIAEADRTGNSANEDVYPIMEEDMETYQRFLETLRAPINASEGRVEDESSVVLRDSHPY